MDPANSLLSFLLPVSTDMAIFGNQCFCMLVALALKVQSYLVRMLFRGGKYPLKMLRCVQAVSNTRVIEKEKLGDSSQVCNVVGTRWNSPGAYKPVIEKMCASMVQVMYFHPEVCRISRIERFLYPCTKIVATVKVKYHYVC